MLNRISWFTTASALVAIWILRLYIPALDELLQRIDFTVEFGGNKVLPIPGGYLFPALAVGILTRIFRFHARLSDWLGIRESFDVEVIIRGLAAQLAIDLTTVSDVQLISARHSIMRKAFYAFVGGSQPQIDLQLVQQCARCMVVVLGRRRGHPCVCFDRFWTDCRWRFRDRVLNNGWYDLVRVEWAPDDAPPMPAVCRCASAGHRRRFCPGRCRPHGIRRVD